MRPPPHSSSSQGTGSRTCTRESQTKPAHTHQLLRSDSITAMHDTRYSSAGERLPVPDSHSSARSPSLPSSLSLLSLFQDAALRIGCIYLSLSLPSSSLPSPAALQPCSTSIPLSSSSPLAPLHLLIPLFCEHKKSERQGRCTPPDLCATISHLKPSPFEGFVFPHNCTETAHSSS